MFTDAGYQGVDKREDTNDIDIDWHVVMRPGKRKVLDKSSLMGAIMDQMEKTKTSIRAKFKHPFRIIKRQFRHVKVRCARKRPAGREWSCNRPANDLQSTEDAVI